MEKKYDVVALGEFLIDFTPAGRTDSGMKLFEQNPGGAPVNMLTAAGKAGLKTAFIGKVGDDMHGNFLVETAKQAGIETKGIVVDDINCLMSRRNVVVSTFRSPLAASCSRRFMMVYILNTDSCRKASSVSLALTPICLIIVATCFSRAMLPVGKSRHKPSSTPSRVSVLWSGYIRCRSFIVAYTSFAFSDI